MASKRNKSMSGNRPMLFGPWNYKVLTLGFALVITGFLSMYMENEVEGIISLFVSPIMIMAGYITVIFAIMKHDNEEQQPTPEQSNS